MPAMVVRHLDDPNDDLLCDYRNVPDPELVARQGLFVAEGRLVVSRLLRESAMAVRSVLVTEPAYASIRGALDARPDVPVLVVPQQVMNGITGYNIHRGCLALGERPPARDWRALAWPAGDGTPDRGPRGARRLVVLERVGDADNVGSIFRNSAAFAVDAVLLGPACADPLYRKAIRTSMGATLLMPFGAVDAWPGALCELDRAGHALVAMTPAEDAMPLRDVAQAIGRVPCAVVLGHEGDGLTPEALAACRHRARIPMARGVDSLNVATAAAVALYELTR